MSSQNLNESMLEMYIFETSQNIEQLETFIITCEKIQSFSQDAINEIFRIMHTIKGSSAMMLFNNIASVTEFSGRGVGMDVVTKNINTIGGSVVIDSVEGVGSSITLKIPLTLAIIDGMNIKIGVSRYTIPTTAIKESFRPKETDIFKDPDGNEMIMVRGQCYPILRLHEFYGIKTQITEFSQGILIMVEQDDKTLCIFADELLGQQQVVVKALPNYIKNTRRIGGLAGCTLLGDGSISLILDVGGLTA